MKLKKGFLRLSIAVFLVAAVLFAAVIFHKSIPICPVSVCPMMPFVALFIAAWSVYKLSKYVANGFIKTADSHVGSQNSDVFRGDKNDN